MKINGRLINHKNNLDARLLLFLLHLYYYFNSTVKLLSIKTDIKEVIQYKQLFYCGI